MPIRSRMSSIMGQIKPENLELFALEFGKIAGLCLLSIIYKYRPISTKFGQNVCDHKILDDFNYESNRTKTELSALELQNLPYLTLLTL